MSTVNDRQNLKALMRHRHAITRGNKGKVRLKRWPVPKAPARMTLAYREFLQKYFNHLKELVTRVLIPKLPHLLSTALRHQPETSRQDDATEDLKKLIEQIDIEFLGEYDDEELIRTAKLLATGVSDLNRQTILGNISEILNIDLFTEEPFLENALAMFAVQNADLIKGVKDNLLDRVSGEVFDAFRQGIRSETLADNIRDAMKISDSRAAFIARDQIGKLNGQLDRLRQTEVGVEKYIWRTELDERVRDTHARNEGKKFSWDDPPDETGHPGEDYNCRCWAEPVLDELIDQGTESETEGDDEGEIE